MTYRSKILVVDDDLSTRVTIEAMLSTGNYELFFAENGFQALSMGAELQPDLVLLDVMMPEMNGFEVCKKFRSMPDLAETPIVLITSLDDRESRMSGIKAGADDFVTKPFQAEELRIRVQNMTRLNPYKHQAVYNLIELKFYEAFVDEPNIQRDQGAMQATVIRNICDYVEAEEAFLVLFDFENPELATKKDLGTGNTWKSERTFLILDSGLINLTTQTITSIDTGTRPISKVDPVLKDTLTDPIRNVLMVPLMFNQTFLGAIYFLNHQFDIKKDDRRFRFLQLMVKGLSNNIITIEHIHQLTVGKASLEASQLEILNSRNTLRTFFDNIPTAIYIIDRFYTIQAINSRRSNRIGKMPEDLVGGKCYEKLFGYSSPCALCRVAETFDGVPLVRNYREWGGKETFTHWEITTVPIRENTNLIGQAIIFEEDITEKWIMEASLIQAEKLASIGQLAASIAHEINTPLSTVIANTQLLMRDLKDADEDTIEALQLIETAGVRAAKIVGGLLESARRDKFQDFEEVSLNETIQTAIAMINFEIKNRSITVNLDLSSEMPNIFVDKNKITGIWINLITNALGAVETSTGVISISTFYEKHQYHVIFSDNGKGILPEHQEHIFKPFFTTKGVGKGTGLGLYVSHQLIKEYQGEMHFESAPGRGTKFIIILPDIERNPY